MRQAVRYSKVVWENDTFEDQRRANCMCLHCGRLDVAAGRNDCPAAPKFFELCKEYGCAFIMTRCSLWQPILATRGGENGHAAQE